MNISASELRQRLENGDPILLIDVREPWEHDEFNIGGKLIPLAELMNRMWEFEDHKDDEIVVYCKSGDRSGMAQRLLMGAGFAHVKNLSGGMLSWGSGM